MPILLEQSGLSGDITYAHIPKQQWMEPATCIKAIPVRITRTRSIKDAFVTGGGVYLKEIDPRSMESKLMSGLYFCGEILDIHGYTGGYNITAAFTTGHNAGTHAASTLKGRG
ncbi:hypothetical protein D1872_248830 [compost metagenome]